jgi:6-pyruvoyltetrahydropterin/6-carboxytetrahydropterin synthase
MTVFPDGSKEALHGHGYSTEVTAELSSGDPMLSFSLFKEPLKALCAQWDEKVLLAKQNPLFQLVEQTPEETEFTLCGKRYVLPTEETVLLPVENITTENLASEILRHLLKALSSTANPSLRALEVRVDESAGQGASARWEFPA